MDTASTLSERFCANDSDLTLGSSDGILFQIHRRNLEAHSEAFAAEDAFLRRHEVVELSETSQVLDLLLQYIYPQPPPNLGTIDCGLLLALAEAAEKYLFHGVIRVCTTHIMDSKLVVNRPLEILLYASRHNHVEIMDQAAEHILKNDLEVPSEVPGWSRYCDAWSKAVRRVYVMKDPLVHYSHRARLVMCKQWPSVYASVAHRIGGRPAALLDIPMLFSAMGHLKRDVGLVFGICRIGRRRRRMSPCE